MFACLRARTWIAKRDTQRPLRWRRELAWACDVTAAAIESPAQFATIAAPPSARASAPRSGTPVLAFVTAYRMTPPGVGYAIAFVAAFSILSGAAGGLGASRSIAADVLFAALVALGVAAPLAMVAWTRGFEVRICDAGIMSMSLRTVQMIRWHDVERFEVDRYRSSPFAVYAVLGDGSRVALEALRGGSSQGGRIEQLSNELEAKLVAERTRHADDVQARAAWPPLPLGWRRRGRRSATPTL